MKESISFNSNTGILSIDVEWYRLSIQMKKKGAGWVFRPVDFNIINCDFVDITNFIDITANVRGSIGDNKRLDGPALAYILMMMTNGHLPVPTSIMNKRLEPSPPPPKPKNYRGSFSIKQYLDKIGIKSKEFWEVDGFLDKKGYLKHKGIIYINDIRCVRYPLSDIKDKVKQSHRLKNALKYNGKYILTYNSDIIYVIPTKAIEELGDGEVLDLEAYGERFDSIK
jgi:hypothetical protein